MTFGEVRDAFYDATGTASERVRTLSVAGIAVVWALRQAKLVNVASSLAQIAVILFVVALLCDFLQYFVQALVWDKKMSRVEKADPDVKAELQLDIPRSMRRPGEVFWVVKSMLLLAGYGVLFLLVSGEWQHWTP